MVFLKRPARWLEVISEEGAYYNNVVVSQAVAAAVAVPPMFAPYSITNPSNGRSFQYYDGEVRETLSAHVARDAGADFIITSSIWSPYQYHHKMGAVSDLGMSAMAEQALHQLVEEKVSRDQRLAGSYYQLMELILDRGQRHGLAPEVTQELSREAAALLRHRKVPTLQITPQPHDHQFFLEGFFRFNQRSLDRCMEAGQRALEHALEQQPQFLRDADQAMTNSISEDTLHN